MAISENKSLIGVLGGTFDPIHLGHINIASDAFSLLGAKIIHMVPTYIPVHRTLPIASADHRLAMIRSIVENEKNIIADPREILRKGKSFMIDTLSSIRADFPSEIICLILGNDAFNKFLSWKNPEQILNISNILVMERPKIRNTGDENLKKLLKNHQCNDIKILKNNNFGKIYFHRPTQIDVSSSDVRKKISKKENLKNLVPEKVLNYISRNNLYR